jgi:hypothetical protein
MKPNHWRILESHRLKAVYRQALIQQEWLTPQTGTEMMAMQ